MLIYYWIYRTTYGEALQITSEQEATFCNQDTGFEKIFVSKQSKSFMTNN